MPNLNINVSWKWVLGILIAAPSVAMFWSGVVAGVLWIDDVLWLFDNIDKFETLLDIACVEGFEDLCTRDAF